MKKPHREIISVYCGSDATEGGADEFSAILQKNSSPTAKLRCVRADSRCY